MNLINFLKGKKTFVVGLLMVALGYLTGDNGLILEGLGFITMRSAVAKIGK